MIVVYGASGGGSVALNLGGGHVSIAFTGVRPNTYISWVRTAGSEVVFKKYKKGIWSEATYRVEIPTVEDGNGEDGLSERDAMGEWEAINSEGESKGETMRDYLGGPDNPAYSAWERKKDNARGIPQEYQHLYGEYNCVTIVKRLLTAARGYEKLSYNCAWASLSVASVCRDAGQMHQALVGLGTQWGDPDKGFFDDDCNFNSDQNIGKSIVPWPYESQRPG